MWSIDEKLIIYRKMARSSRRNNVSLMIIHMKVFAAVTANGVPIAIPKFWWFYNSAKFRCDEIILQDMSGELNQEWNLGHLGLSE